jgi:hypothetical protein
MSLEISGKTRVYRKEFDGRVSYSIGFSKKKDDGTYLTAFQNVSFRKGVDIPHKTEINITKAWFSPYEYKDKAGYNLFISEFECDSDLPQGIEYAEVTEEDMPF